jgi:hypothetical protein
MSESLAKPESLLDTITRFILRYGSCVVATHPDDAGAIDAEKYPPMLRDALLKLIDRGAITFTESRYLERGLVTVMAPPGALWPFEPLGGFRV